MPEQTCVTVPATPPAVIVTVLPPAAGQQGTLMSVSTCTVYVPLAAVVTVLTAQGKATVFKAICTVAVPAAVAVNVTSAEI